MLAVDVLLFQRLSPLVPKRDRLKISLKSSAMHHRSGISHVTDEILFYIINVTVYNSSST